MFPPPTSAASGELRRNPDADRFGRESVALRPGAGPGCSLGDASLIDQVA